MAYRGLERPTNFMEIGGDAYRKGKEALAVVLGNAHVKVLLVNLCGAYARTDVMIEGFLAGWQALDPTVPVVFSIHGTGEERAIQLVHDALGVEPFDEMDDAVPPWKRTASRVAIVRPAPFASTPISPSSSM